MMTITGTLLAGLSVVTVALEAPFCTLAFGTVAMWMLLHAAQRYTGGVR